MKPGSLVHLINKAAPYQKYVKLEKTYTVDEVITKGEIVATGKNGFILMADENGIRLSEVYVPDIYWFEYDMIIKQTFPMKDFAELLPPIENIEETINANVQEFELI